MFFSLPPLYEFDHNYYANYFSLEKVRGYWVFANLGGFGGLTGFSGWFWKCGATRSKTTTDILTQSK
jgi:hypothetical protein